MNKNIKTFIYDWVLKEWYKKNKPTMYLGKLRLWTKIKCPYVILFFKLGGGSSYMRLWEDKCGKQFIVFDIGRISKRWGEQVGDKRRRNG